MAVSCKRKYVERITKNKIKNQPTKMTKNESKMEILEHMNLDLKEKMKYEQGITLDVSRSVREKYCI